MGEKYYSLNELINFIEEPNRSCCKKLYEENKELIESGKGSKTKHQSWKGGYVGHLTETMNIAIVIYNSLNARRKLEFSIQDVLLILFLHDLEKPWKYSSNNSNIELYKQSQNSEEFKRYIIEKYSFNLSENLWKGLKHVHGEVDDFDPHIKIQSSLSAFAHICDNISARIWFNFPNESDRWSRRGYFS